MAMTVAQLAAALIRSLEGMRTTAYKDTGGVWTCGLGHTLNVNEGDTCTQEQAEQWLAEDSAALFALVEGRPLLEAAALASFGYNCGAGRLKALFGGDVVTGVRNGPQRDRKGNLLPGLVARRNLEACLIEASRDMEGK